jgi:uncharacterized membrane protein YbhN (UPF0104 family)
MSHPNNTSGEASPRSINPLLRGLLPYGLTLAAIVGMVWYVRRTDLFEAVNLAALRWEWIVLIVLAEAAAFAFRGLLVAVFVADDGIHLTPVEWFGLAVGSNVSNIVIPVSGGVVARAGYLKARYGYPIPKFSALAAASYLIIFFVSGLTGLSILALYSLRGLSIDITAVLVLAAMTLGPVLVLILPVEKLPLRASNRLLRWVRAALDGWRIFRTNLGLLLQAAVVVFLLQVSQAVAIYFSLKGIAPNVPFMSALLIGVLVNLSNFVRITPGALGVREAVAGLAAQLAGYTIADGFGAALLSRGAKWLISFTLGPVLLFILTRRAQERIEASSSQGS